MTDQARSVTRRGQSFTLVGPQLKVGDSAPDFELVSNIFSTETTTLADSTGKIRLFSVIPSINTGICDAQTRRFNEEIGSYGEQVIGYAVSTDLPVAQQAWCNSAGIENIRMLSDYRSMSFGSAYGTNIKDLRLEQRAVFIVDANETIQYVEYVPEISQHPDYEAALAALRRVAG